MSVAVTFVKNSLKIRYFRGQADLDENFTHKNIGVIYRNACNAVHVRKQINFILMKITAVFNFLPHENDPLYSTYISITIA